MKYTTIRSVGYFNSWEWSTPASTGGMCFIDVGRVGKKLYFRAELVNQEHSSSGRIACPKNIEFTIDGQDFQVCDSVLRVWDTIAKHWTTCHGWHLAPVKNQ